VCGILLFEENVTFSDLLIAVNAGVNTVRLYLEVILIAARIIRSKSDK
jgi:hypothetical protein